MGWSSETAWSFRHTPTVGRNLNFTTWLCLQPGDLLSPLADNYEQKSLQAMWTMCERQAFEQNKHKGNNNGAFTNARCVELSLWWMEITFKSLCKFLHTGWMCVLKYSCKMVRVDPFFNNQTPSFFIAFNTTTIKKKYICCPSFLAKSGTVGQFHCKDLIMCKYFLKICTAVPFARLKILPCKNSFMLNGTRKAKNMSSDRIAETTVT